ncbi:MAG: hypothetical protein LBO20_02070 [Bifidobacteriaceae bacterium]|nr:hypothetical protein [Bifidobacteriaceae bacterium]
MAALARECVFPRDVRAEAPGLAGGSVDGGAEWTESLGSLLAALAKCGFWGRLRAGWRRVGRQLG